MVGDANSSALLMIMVDSLHGAGAKMKRENAARGKEFIAAGKQATYLSLIWGDSEKTQALRVNISSSLLDLHHLRSLDLSYNDFNMSQIPEFIGSIT